MLERLVVCVKAKRGRQRHCVISSHRKVDFRQGWLVVGQTGDESRRFIATKQVGLIEGQEGAEDVIEERLVKMVS